MISRTQRFLLSAKRKNVRRLHTHSSQSKTVTKTLLPLFEGPPPKLKWHVGGVVTDKLFVGGSWSLSHTAKTEKQLPSMRSQIGKIPHVAFFGRSNVGKSSLLNALLNRTKGMAVVSKKPGRTQSVNFWSVGPRHRFVLADVPGIGYASAPQRVVDAWNALLGAYVRTCAPHMLKMVYFLIDSRRAQLKEHELECLQFLCTDCQVPVQLILTKVDKVAPQDLALTVRTLAETLSALGSVQEEELGAHTRMDDCPRTDDEDSGVTDDVLPQRRGSAQAQARTQNLHGEEGPSIPELPLLPPPRGLPTLSTHVHAVSAKRKLGIRHLRAGIAAHLGL